MDGARPSWFEGLRRDGRLFATLGLLLVLVHSLQPLAVARAAGDGHFVICTMLGSEPPADGTPIRHDGCDACVAGHCAPQPAARAAVPSAIAWTPLVAQAFDRRPFRSDALTEAPPPQGPPGIRAPPSSS